MISSKQKQKVLITGGAGFIGSHVTELFCNEGFNVTVVDDLSFGYRKFVDKRATFLNFSLANYKALEKALKGIDVVIHLAGSSIISTSYKKPVDYFQNNLMHGLNLLEAMRKNKVKKIIYSSSSSVYGEPKKTPIAEDTLPNPLNAYAASKLAFEEALSAYYHAYGIESIIFRYYNAYGPRDEQKPVTRAIPMWIAAIVRKKSVPWYWKGRQTRDYVYVSDIAQAHLQVLPLRGQHTFNIGSGQGVVMKDVLKTLEDIVGRKLKTKDLGQRKGDPMKSFADISKINTATGWSPQISLKQGLEKTYEYYKKHYEAR